MDLKEIAKEMVEKRQDIEKMKEFLSNEIRKSQVIIDAHIEIRHFLKTISSGINVPTFNIGDMVHDNSSKFEYYREVTDIFISALKDKGFEPEIVLKKGEELYNELPKYQFTVKFN